MQTKEFGAKVPAELLNEFRFLFPMYGATTWFINESLRVFVETVRNDPQAQHRIADSINEMLEERRSDDDESTDDEGDSERNED